MDREAVDPRPPVSLRSDWPLPSRVDAAREASHELLDRVAVKVNENRLSRVCDVVGQMTAAGPHGYLLAVSFLKSVLRDAVAFDDPR